MAGSDKALMWVAHDFSEEKGAEDKLAVKFKTTECNIDVQIVANEFKEHFNKARQFNIYLKAGDESKLVMAPVIVEEKKEESKKEEEKKEEEKKEEQK